MRLYRLWKAAEITEKLDKPEPAVKLYNRIIKSIKPSGNERSLGAGLPISAPNSV